MATGKGGNGVDAARGGIFYVVEDDFNFAFFFDGFGEGNDQGMTSGFVVIALRGGVAGGIGVIAVGGGIVLWIVGGGFGLLGGLLGGGAEFVHGGGGFVDGGGLLGGGTFLFFGGGGNLIGGGGDRTDGIEN